jgi:hypothetical protein
VIRVIGHYKLGAFETTALEEVWSDVGGMGDMREVESLKLLLGVE